MYFKILISTQHVLHLTSTCNVASNFSELFFLSFLSFQPHLCELLKMFSTGYDSCKILTSDRHWTLRGSLILHKKGAYGAAEPSLLCLEELSVA